jgi:hypothetical protein
MMMMVVLKMRMMKMMVVSMMMMIMMIIIMMMMMAASVDNARIALFHLLNTTLFFFPVVGRCHSRFRHVREAAV